jgi:dihydrofolate synthase / folylpolyglutamate synthase
MNDDTAYQETLDYIYSYIDYSLQRSFRYAPEKFDLARMREWAALLGDPHQAYPVIHIAGTKGKGSVSALCASALQACGFRVGVYTSPHLQDYTERIQVNGQAIARAELVELVGELKPVIQSVPDITTFEITTGIAFLYFARQAVDIAVIEVGLGGRLDATNIVSPLVSVITSLSYDHMELLGNTLAEIAGEKAGIIKPGRPVVVSPQQEEARQVVSRIAAERKSPLTQVGRDYIFTPMEHSLEGQSFRFWSSSEQVKMDAFLQGHQGNEWEPELFQISLLGLHQVENAATAYTALLVAQGAGLSLKKQCIKEGFLSAQWPGRFELLQQNPPVLIDCAHNRDSSSKLRQALDDYFPGRSIVMLLGASEDKDLEGIVAELVPRAGQVIASQSIHPRAAEPERLVELAHQYGRPAKAIPRIEDALVEAIKAAGKEGMVVATGSIFLAAGVRFAWQKYMEKKTPA